MVIVLYKINKFEIYSINISQDAKVRDFLDAASEKHKKKFVSIYSEQFKEFVNTYDNISDWIRVQSIFYISENNDLNPEDYDNSASIQLFSPDFKVIESISEDPECKTFLIQYKSKTKYYAHIYKNFKMAKKFNNSILSSVNHGSLSVYTGYCTCNFDKGQKYFLFSKFYTNGFLSNLLYREKIEKSIPFFGDTQRMIIIYGIAAGMSFLNSIGLTIQNCELSTEKVLLDRYLFPKVGFYIKTFENGLNYNLNYDTEIDTTIPLAELDIEITIEKTPIMLFSFILYELLMRIRPFGTIDFSIIKKFRCGERPPVYHIPFCFQKLINDCWNPDPNKRPSFDEIVSRLKSDSNLILYETDKDIYYEYIKLIDDYTKFASEAKDELVSFEYFVSEKSDKFQTINCFENEEEEEDKGERNQLNIKSINLQSYSKIRLVGEGLYGEVYQVKSKDTKKIFSAKISKNKIFKAEENKTNIYREAMIISQLNHPAILKFVGYNPKNFEGENKPVILTEFSSNGSLDQLFELTRHRVKIEGWNDTKKLINIYGIASCMSYLHSLNIVHRDLKTKNILLDSYLYPKLANFCFATLPKNFKLHQQNQGLMGNPFYYAPEIFNSEEYSKSSDVYAFSLVVFEIITGKKPFNYDTVFQVMTKVMNGERPVIDDIVPQCYQNLIKSCWSQDPSKRPTFEQIVDELRKNESFRNNIDAEEYQTYINYIDEYMKAKKNILIKEYFKNIKLKKKLIYL